MNQQDLIRFLNRVYVWIPHTNPMRREIEELVRNLGGTVSKLSSQPVVEKQQPEETA
jgi:hypothetical protein